MIDPVLETSAYCRTRTRPASATTIAKGLRMVGYVAASLVMVINLSGPGASAQSTASPMLLAASTGAEQLPDAPGMLDLTLRPGLGHAAGIETFSSSSSSSSKAAEGRVGGGDTINGARMAGPYVKYIEPGEQVPRLTARDKAILGLKDAVSPFSMIGWVASAGYEQVTDNSPNYGQTGQGFAQRLGAGAARDFTEGTFGDSVLSPLLHEDPRYYRLGKGHPFFKRLIYAGTRGLITRTDGGHETVNFANIGGNLGGAFLTDVYYPDRNTTLSETMQTFGSSVGGSALGFAVSEFLPDVFHAFHLPAPGY